MLALRCFIITSTFLLCFSAHSQAETDPLYKQALIYYSQRNNPVIVDQAIWELNLAYKKTSEPELAYKIKILSARFYLWKALVSTNVENQKTYYQQALLDADKAKEIGLIDLNRESADAYYYHGLAVYKWAECKGENEMIARRKQIILDMESAMSLQTFEYADGMTLDSYGPLRLLGMLYHNLPKLYEGSRDRALNLLYATYQKDNKYLLNGLYLAKVLLEGKLRERQDACGIVDQMLLQKPENDPLTIRFENQFFYTQIISLNIKSCSLGGI